MQLKPGIYYRKLRLRKYDVLRKCAVGKRYKFFDKYTCFVSVQKSSKALFSLKNDISSFFFNSFVKFIIRLPCKSSYNGLVSLVISQ